MDSSVMRQMMGKDAAPASYFLLVKNGNSATSLQTKNTFPLTGHCFTVCSPELEAQMHGTQKLSAGQLRTSHVPNQTHNNIRYGPCITLELDLPSASIASAATVTPERSPGACATQETLIFALSTHV